jgi:hypothetical protein
MKNKWLLTFSVITLLLLSTTVFATEPGGLSIGVKAGANLSNIYDSDGEDFEADSKLGFAAGAFLSIPIGTFLGVQPELMFSQRGLRGSGTILFSDYTFVRTTNYIDVPLLLAIKPIPEFTLLVGPQYSYLISQSYEFNNEFINIDQQEEFENENIRKNILCITGGFDVNLNNLVLGARAGWDLLDNNGDGTSTTPRYKNMWAQATIGYRF